MTDPAPQSLPAADVAQSYGHDYSPGVYINQTELNRLAEVIAAALLEQERVHVKVPRGQLVERIAAVLLASMRAEEALEHEAERLAEKHSREMAGMDQRRIIEGIKARLAKERGFPL